MCPVITIDGPTASGKGTISFLVSKELGFRFLDSGVLYRLIAFFNLKKYFDINNFKEILEFFSKCTISFDNRSVIFNGLNIYNDIYSEKIGCAASKIAVNKSVRKALFLYQRNFYRYPGLVANGRDMGTVVFSDAVLKIFLTADLNIRVVRRYFQLIKQGFYLDINKLFFKLFNRDKRDMNRCLSPLKPAINSYLLDNSCLSIKQSVKKILELYKNISILK